VNKTLKKKWVKALRSGKYKQTRGRLRTKNGARHCCLGVLCELMGRSDWAGDPQTLPADELEKAGIPLVVGTALARMNDGFDPADGEFITEEGDEPVREHSFSEIADHIEKNL